MQKTMDTYGVTFSSVGTLGSITVNCADTMSGVKAISTLGVKLSPSSLQKKNNELKEKLHKYLIVWVTIAAIT